MPKFHVMYEKPNYYVVDVEAANEDEAERLADEQIARLPLETFYYAEGDLEVHLVEKIDG